MPAYNMERFIGRALNSAVNQTYPNLEVLVIDDGSTDGTRHIAERVAAEHSNIRVISTANEGVAAARNTGIRLADAHYLAFFDADDLWHPAKIERQVAALAALGHEGEWAGSYVLHRMIDEDDRVLDDGPSKLARGDFFEEHLIWNPVGNGSSLLVRRDAALAVGGFNSDYARAGIGGCEDLEFQLKLLRRFKLEAVAEYLVGYRLHRMQMSSDTVRMRLSQIAVIEKMTAGNETSPTIRNRALVHAYLIAAKGYLLARDWRGAFRWTLSSFSLSTADSLKRVAMQVRHEARYWSCRLVQSLLPKAWSSRSLPSYGELDPSVGLDEGRRLTAPYRSSLHGETRSRASSQPPGAATQNDHAAGARPARPRS